MMEGSSLRMMVGMYSALGTLEEISWGQHRELLRKGPATSELRGREAQARSTPCCWAAHSGAPRGAQTLQTHSGSCLIPRQRQRLEGAGAPSQGRLEKQEGGQVSP